MTGNFFRLGWRLMPDRVTVSYRTQASLGSYNTAFDVPNSWWRPGVTVEGAPSDGVYLRGLRTYLFPKSAFTPTALSPAPAVGDLIINSVTQIDPVQYTWTVTGTTEAGALGAWQLECVSLQLQSNLRQTCDVTRPTNAKDAAFRLALTSFTSVASSVPCRLQPQDGGASAGVFDRTTIPLRYSLYLGIRVAVRAKDVVTVSGSTYSVISSEMPDRITDLQLVTVEEIL